MATTSTVTKEKYVAAATTLYNNANTLYEKITAIRTTVEELRNKGNPYWNGAAATNAMTYLKKAYAELVETYNSCVSLYNTVYDKYDVLVSKGLVK